VRLKIHETLPTSQQLALFETPLRDPHRFGETLARLHALAGQNRVGVPLRASTHKPGVFQLLDPCSVFGTPKDGTPKDGGRLCLLSTAAARPSLQGIPMRRFRPAIPANVSLKHHRPERIHAAHLCGPVLECAGPYRLSGEWWDGNAWRIEEWDVRLGGGARGLYRLACDHGPPKVWSVEGCYDASTWPETH
jgi:protein ImuB